MKRTKTVDCYALRPLLTNAQWAAVAPFVRGTFTETWREVTAHNYAVSVERCPNCRARNKLVAAAGLREADAGDGDGVLVERRLYAKAQRLSHPVIAGPARGKR